MHAEENSPYFSPHRGVSTGCEELASGTRSFSRVKRLRLTQDTVELGSTDRADALCHTATRVRDLDFAFEGTLLFALHTVSARVVFKLSYIFFGHRDPPIAAATRRDAQVLPALSVRTRSGYP
jgi:hypothetical protein